MMKPETMKPVTLMWYLSDAFAKNIDQVYTDTYYRAVYWPLSTQLNIGPWIRQQVREDMFGGVR